MTDEKPRRPRWRKKRWIAAGLVWLAVAYPISIPPMAYCAARGWLPEAHVDPYIASIRAVVMNARGTARLGLAWYLDAVLSSHVLGQKHAALR